MNASQMEMLSEVCKRCDLEGGCCHGARPPLTQKRIDILIEHGVKPENVDPAGYKKLRLKEDGFCVLFHDGHCTVHSIKPETCVAGPFTFDVKGSILEIFLKKEGICPMVRCLKEDREIYDSLFDLSVQKIVELVEALPKDELSEILKIEEPETELVAEIKLKGISC
ncbi:MAG TPA: YkgJ family cysteine cluster protein [Methanotrichaceae archaeon]|nr:YkgJ family cysteine cluster protein [Methanotrichaceae archaeon]